MEYISKVRIFSKKQLCILCVVYEFPCFKGFDSIAQKFFLMVLWEIITPFDVEE
jgi:hypothetical protein